MTKIPVTDTNNPAEKCWKLLFRVTDALRNQSHKKPQDPTKKITLARLRIMGCLFEHNGRTLMLKEIAEKFNFTPGAVSQTIDSLVKEGLVERLASPTDRRAVCIRLTREGEEIRNHLDRSFTGSMEKLLVEIPKEKLESFLEVLEFLHARLRAEK